MSSDMQIKPSEEEVTLVLTAIEAGEEAGTESGRAEETGPGEWFYYQRHAWHSAKNPELKNPTGRTIPPGTMIKVHTPGFHDPSWEKAGCPGPQYRITMDTKMMFMDSPDWNHNFNVCPCNGHFVKL
jgi:hypothetical protein